LGVVVDEEDAKEAPQESHCIFVGFALAACGLEARNERKERRQVGQDPDALTVRLKKISAVGIPIHEVSSLLAKGLPKRQEK
jgi:hypothetical protein